MTTPVHEHEQATVVEQNIRAGRLSPAARGMSFGDVLRQYHDANSLTWRQTFTELGLPVDYDDCMTDTRVELIVRAAYVDDNYTGSDMFGYCVAWIDLDDWLSVEPSDYTTLDIPRCLDGDALGYWLRTAPGMRGHRYALAYWGRYGERLVTGFKSRKRMMEAFRRHEGDWLAWLEDNRDELAY